MKTIRPVQPQAPDNVAIADRLDEVAALLELQGANPFRVRAYRNATELVRELDRSLEEILDAEGHAGLTRLPGIGRSLSAAIEQLLHSGRLRLLERLRGVQPEEILATVPGIGRKTAARIHEQLGIETLAELEQAAFDGRLKQVPGIGAKRIRGVRESIAGRLRRRPGIPQRLVPQPIGAQPSVAELLDVDREYRRKANAGKLPLIAPRRFNPTGQAWLPVLHAEREERHYTALYSNTARAHELGTIRDWVVLYRDDHDDDGQWTVVTARFGPAQGHRIVRGREAECAEHYERVGAGADDDST